MGSDNSIENIGGSFRDSEHLIRKVIGNLSFRYLTSNDREFVGRVPFLMLIAAQIYATGLIIERSIMWRATVF